MKTESSTNSPTATLAPTKSQRDPVGLQATSPPSHLTGDLRTMPPSSLFSPLPILLALCSARPGASHGLLCRRGGYFLNILYRSSLWRRGGLELLTRDAPLLRWCVKSRVQGFNGKRTEHQMKEGGFFRSRSTLCWWC